MTVKQIKQFLADNKKSNIYGVIDYGPFSGLVPVNRDYVINAILPDDNDLFLNAYIDEDNDLIFG